jgi:putative ribosome biogenesis GTPase RsgA
MMTLISFRGGLTVVSRIVGLPKVGALRAATVYFKSIFKSASPITKRSKEMNYLISEIVNLGRGNYLLVTGDKGVGKSRLVDSTLN